MYFIGMEAAYQLQNVLIFGHHTEFQRSITDDEKNETDNQKTNKDTDFTTQMILFGLHENTSILLDSAKCTLFIPNEKCLQYLKKAE